MNGWSSGSLAGKVWGSTRQIFAGSNVEVHRIEARKDAYCSKHRHAHKFNGFFVETGKLQIEIWQQDYALCDVTFASAGDWVVVPPGLYHRFTALENSVAFEIYWVDLNSRDIERETVGGA